HHRHRTSDQLLYDGGGGFCAADDKLSCPHFRCYHDGRRYRAHGKGREMNSYRWTAAGGSVYNFWEMHKLDFAWSICYIQYRQKDIRVLTGTARNPGGPISGGSLFHFCGWIKPEVSYRLFIAV